VTMFNTRWSISCVRPLQRPSARWRETSGRQERGERHKGCGTVNVWSTVKQRDGKNIPHQCFESGRCKGLRSGCRVKWRRRRGAGCCYRSRRGGGVGGGLGGRGRLLFAGGAAACAEELVERAPMCRGARRRRSLGVHGSLSWARCEGATGPASSSTSASHGGSGPGATGSRSGVKAGFSMPAGRKGGNGVGDERV